MLVKTLQHIRVSLAVCMGMIVLLGGILWYTSVYNHSLEVFFLDVGQGDSTLIKTPQGSLILIDGGPDNHVLDAIGRATSFFDHHFDMVIATHPDADHIGGLVSVLSRYDVSLILDPCVVHDSALFQTYQTTIANKQIPVRCVDAEQQYVFEDGVVLDILYPNISFESRDIANNNDASIVVRVSYDDTSFLFMADAPIAVEKKLIERHADILDVDILKIGHHGSDTSTDITFLEATSPSVATVSLGAGNRYGHPSERVLLKLQEKNIPLLRSDIYGTLRFTSDGTYIYGDTKLK